MNKTTMLIPALALVVACASPGLTPTPQQQPNFSRLGLDALNKNHLAEAEDFLSQAIRSGGNPRSDWHNLGVVYERRWKSEPERRAELAKKAITAFNVGARYGNPLSQQALTNWKQPVPPVDLAIAKQSTLPSPNTAPPTATASSDSSVEAAALFLGILGAGLQGYNEGRRSAARSWGDDPAGLRPRSITCNTMALGKDYLTDCR